MARIGFAFTNAVDMSWKGNTFHMGENVSECGAEYCFILQFTGTVNHPEISTWWLFVVRYGDNFCHNGVTGTTDQLNFISEVTGDTINILFHKFPLLMKENKEFLFTFLVARGDVDGIIYMVDRNVMITQRPNPDGEEKVDIQEALYWSCFYGHLRAVQYLLNNGANLHTKYHYAFCEAVQRGHKDVLELLCEHATTFEALDVALIEACKIGRLDMVKFLVESGANVRVNEGKPVRKAMDGDFHEIANYLVKHGA